MDKEFVLVIYYIDNTICTFKVFEIMVLDCVQN